MKDKQELETYELDQVHQKQKLNLKTKHARERFKKIIHDLKK